MATKPPYMNAYGTITKALNKIRDAATPARFTQDFLATKLGLKGGSPKAVIPYLKRIGFLGSDGVPTDLYKQFRNTSESGAAAAAALRHGYSALFEVNEYINEASDKDLKGAIVQLTGAEPSSSTVKAIIGSFKALNSFADATAAPMATEAPKSEPAADSATDAPPTTPSLRAQSQLGLSYSINLNLPATSDIAVFDAIFKSLREHLLR